VYTDPRLEVAGADLFERYRKLQERIVMDEYESGWEAELNTMGRPVILVDHEYNSPGATLLRSTHWRQVWFDAIAAVFVHDTATEAVREHASISRSGISGRSLDRPRASRLGRPWPRRSRNYVTGSLRTAAS
jgi:hypothetical protein